MGRHLLYKTTHTHPIFSSISSNLDRLPFLILFLQLLGFCFCFCFCFCYWWNHRKMESEAEIVCIDVVRNNALWSKVFSAKSIFIREDGQLSFNFFHWNSSTIIFSTCFKFLNHFFLFFFFNFLLPFSYNKLLL